MQRSKPNTEDQITHVDSFGQVHEGEVIDLLSTQFTYEVECGLIKFAFYSDEWRHNETR